MLKPAKLIHCALYLSLSLWVAYTRASHPIAVYHESCQVSRPCMLVLMISLITSPKTRRTGVLKTAREGSLKTPGVVYCTLSLTSYGNYVRHYAGMFITMQHVNSSRLGGAINANHRNTRLAYVYLVRMRHSIAASTVRKLLYSILGV
jgi:hypothetical protein